MSRAAAWSSQRNRAALALVAALAQLIGSVGAYVHFAFVRHERCAEHGELVHAGASERGGGHHAATAPLSTTEGPAGLGSADAGKHEHDPCSVVASVRKRQLTAPVASTVIEAEVGDGVAPYTSSDVGCERELYQLAPKTSPPSTRA
jgi:hypothetical protein